ncbi:hypothetical protein V6N13_028365 [Hibiscus sabdariffa]
MVPFSISIFGTTRKPFEEEIGVGRIIIISLQAVQGIDLHKYSYLAFKCMVFCAQFKNIFKLFLSGFDRSQRDSSLAQASIAKQENMNLPSMHNEAGTCSNLLINHRVKKSTLNALELVAARS